MLRKLAAGIVALIVVIGGYAAWPLLSAYQIKQAIRTGDVALLEHRVKWAPVRASLKDSLAQLTPRTDDEHREHGMPRPSLWGRIKAAAAPMLVDRLVDTYVTAEGLTKLQQARAKGGPGLAALLPGASMVTNGQAAAAADDGSNVMSRMLGFYQRIVRAKFHSLSEVEFEIADKSNPARRYISQFELSGLEWKLASVRVVGVGF